MTAPTPDETILGILASNPQHGYQLLDHFNRPENLGRVWSMSTSQVYAVLKRLETEGLVDGRLIEAKDAPPRTEYSLTESGKRRLDEWLYDPEPSPSIRRVRVEFFSKLYVASLLGLAVDQIINFQKQACLLQKQIIWAEASGKPLALNRLVVEFIGGQLDAAINWLDECQNYFSKMDTDDQ